MIGRARIACGAILGAALAVFTAGCPGEKTVHFVNTTAVAAAAPVTGTAYAIAARDLFGLADAFRADTPDGFWTRLAPPGPDNTFGLGIDPFAPDSVFAIGVAIDSAESFAFRSDDRGQTWDRLTAGLPAPVDPHRAVAFVAPDPGVKDRVWLGYRFAQGVSGTALFRSDDRGQRWNAAGAGISGRDALAIAFDAADPRTRLLLTDSRISRTQDAGGTWVDFDLGIPAKRQIVALVADPSGAGRAYALVNVARVGRLFRIESGGGWIELPAVPLLRDPFGDPVNPVTLAIDPTNPARIFLGVFRFGVFRSDDGGGSFAPKSLGMADATVHKLTPGVFLIDPSAPARVVVATNDGIYLSDDGGDSWRPASAAGLPVLTITFL